MNNPNWKCGDRFKLGGPDSSVGGEIQGESLSAFYDVYLDGNYGVNSFSKSWFDEHATQIPNPLKRGDRVRVIEGGWKDRKGIVLCEWDEKEMWVSLDDNDLRVTVIKNEWLTLEDSDAD